MTSVTVWNEHLVERADEEEGEADEADDGRTPAEIYPEGIHATIAEALDDRGFEVRTATLADPEHGLTEDVLADTDVLTWWGHEAHDEVSDEVVERVRQRVLDGMGLIVLHSGHFSKIFKRLMGTTCDLKWRDEGETERLWAVEPGHPVAAGVPESIEIPETEMYGERFDVPAPETLVFTSWFEGGEVFRSGCCYRRGAGRIFYFRPGHETYPIYHQPEIRRVLANAASWTSPVDGPKPSFGNAPTTPGSSKSDR